MIPGSDRRALASQLAGLGLTAGDVVLVHASLRRVAPLAGTAATVIGALLDVLGSSGTLAVPTQTAWNSTTSRVHRAALATLDEEQARAYRASLPAFDPRTTPSADMGAVAEGVRTMPGAHRSSHPQTSFAAIGRRAADLMSVHDLDCHLGKRSPMGALYEASAKVLLLGVGYEVCTAFHLAEYLYGPRPLRDYECRISGRPGDGWTPFRDIELEDGDFGQIGKEFEEYGHAAGLVRTGLVGAATSRSFAVRDAVDYAVAWLRRFAT